MLGYNDGADKLAGLAKKAIVTTFAPLIRAIFLKKTPQKLVKLLQNIKLSTSFSFAEHIWIECFKFDPNQNGSFVEIHIGFEESNWVYLLKATVWIIQLGLMLLMVLALPISILLWVDLFSNDCLIAVFHFVEVLSVQVIHQNREASHNLCLLFDACWAFTTSSQINLI